MFEDVSALIQKVSSAPNSRRGLSCFWVAESAFTLWWGHVCHRLSWPFCVSFNLFHKRFFKQGVTHLCDRGGEEGRSWSAASEPPKKVVTAAKRGRLECAYTQTGIVELATERQWGIYWADLVCKYTVMLQSWASSVCHVWITRRNDIFFLPFRHLVTCELLACLTKPALVTRTTL